MKQDDDKEIFDGKWYSHPPMRNALIAGLLVGAAFVMAHTRLVSSQIEVAIYVVAIVIGGYHWIREGFEELIEEKEVGIDILMFAAVVGSAVLGMWDEAAFLVFLYGAAEGLEEYTYARTRASIRKLLDLAPKEVRIIKDGEETVVPAEEIAIGDLFVVRPGESIATDGVIVKGTSSINEAPVTGESIPVEKREGMKVFAASINHEGALQIKATANFADNTLSKMVHLVEEAQEQKSNTQAFIDRFGRIYSPIVLLASALLVVVPVILGVLTQEWAMRAVVLLVAAAPCALVMSTPVAVAAGIGKAGRSGILVKGGVHLENLGRIKVVAFDKTGTLTSGKPVVTDIVALNGDPEKVLRLAKSVEKFSEHPLAQAIVAKAEGSGGEDFNATGFKALVGSGVKAEVDGETFYVGSPELFGSLGTDTAGISELQRLTREGKTAVLVGTQKNILGIIALRDEPKPTAKGVVEQLRQKGIRVVILTGDNEMTARAIGEELGVDEVRAGLKPEDKIKVVEEIQQKYGSVAMVGDGINDAPALARATVGIAMGIAGTDAAIQAADTALMADDLTKVVYALSLGKKSRIVSTQNIVFSLLILGVLIPSALIGIMTVAAAVLFHESAELIAVANGLRAGRA